MVVAAMRSTTARRLTSGLPRQVWVMWQNMRCSILFHFDVPGGIMADLQGQPGFVGQLLQFQLPQPHPRTVRAAAVGGDQSAGSTLG